MLGRRAISSLLRNGRPMPWNRPSRSNSLAAFSSSRTSSVGKSSTRMITPSHRSRKPFGRRSKISCAMASISASDGAFALVHIVPVYRVFRVDAYRFVIGPRLQLTLARQSETLRPRTGLDGCHDADRDSGNIGRFCRRLLIAARSRSPGANRAKGYADGAGIAADSYRGVRAAPYQQADDTPARLSELRTGAQRRLSPILSRAQRGAGLHRNLRGGIPAERHGDRASDELLLAWRLSLGRYRRRRAAPITSADVP